MINDNDIAKEMASCAELADQSGKFIAAGRLLEIACSLDPQNPEYCAQLGLNQLKLGEVRAAGKSLARSLKLDSGRFISWDEMLSALTYTKQWSLLEKSCHRALKAGYRAADIYMGLGTALYQQGNAEDAKAAFLKSIAMTGASRELYTVLLENGVESFSSRKRALDFVAAHLPTIKTAAAAAPLGKEILSERSIFVYWGQGFATAPELVKACYKQLVKHNENVIALDDDNLSIYFDLPTFVAENENISMAHKSDIIRICLLAMYGGIWIDATGYCTGSLYDFFETTIKAEFFAYRSRENLISNWFLCSRKNSYITKTMAAALLHHWKTFKEPLDYFVFHQIFEALIITDKQFSLEWKTIPSCNRSASLKLARQLGNSHSELSLTKLLESSAVHKLTHKYNRKYSNQEFAEDCVLNKILQRSVSD